MSPVVRHRSQYQGVPLARIGRPRQDRDQRGTCTVPTARIGESAGQHHPSGTHCHVDNREPVSLDLDSPGSPGRPPLGCGDSA